ncbi:hypothetical protein R3P38DRAFT_2578440, partial [Favolaschia claudopus]
MNQDSLSVPSSSPTDFETDAAAIDVPHGEQDSYAPAAPEPDSDNELEEEDTPERSIPGGPGLPWEERKPPSQTMALEALEAINLLLFVPPAQGKRKRKIPKKINGWSRQHLTDISTFLNLYTAQGSNTRGQWMESSVQAALGIKGAGTRYGAARSLRSRAKKYILSREVPVNTFGTWAKSKLETHPELAEELKAHLVSIGKYVQASDIITFMNRADVHGKYNLAESVSLATAKRWMHALKFRWVKNHKGQYVDGHEREDVVRYRQEFFLPAWYKMEGRMRSWRGDNMDD